MGDKIRLFTADEIERLLSRYGFVMISQKGSHRKWRNLSNGKQVIIPFRSGKTIPLGTLRNILSTAEIPKSEWKR
jgi:predicted RNA binding protein YcfA (HicA-like mRNA interferase family)